MRSTMTPDYKLVLYISEIIRKWKWLEISDATALTEIKKALTETEVKKNG